MLSEFCGKASLAHRKNREIENEAMRGVEKKTEDRGFAWHTTNELFHGVWDIIELSFSFYSRVADSVTDKDIVFVFRLGILQAEKAAVSWLWRWQIYYSLN